jgi:hypothetical protein
MVFKRSFQELQLYNWNLFNWNSNEKVMNLQSCEIHNLQISGLILGTFEEKINFNVVLT